MLRRRVRRTPAAPFPAAVGAGAALLAGLSVAPGVIICLRTKVAGLRDLR